MATVAQDLAVSLAEESSPIYKRRKNWCEAAPSLEALCLSQVCNKGNFLELKGCWVPECTDLFPISICSELEMTWERSLNFMLSFCWKHLHSCSTFNDKQTQWHLFPNAFLGDISPLSIKCTQTQQWTLILGWHLNRELGKINRSLLSSEEGIIYFQVWHSFCFLSLEKGEEMGYWNQEMWDLHQVIFVTGHFYHFYVFISYPALVIPTLILAIIF